MIGGTITWFWGIKDWRTCESSHYLFCRQKMTAMYRWVITYTGNDENDEGRPNVKGPWVVSKRICMKNFFNALSENPEL